MADNTELIVLEFKNAKSKDEFYSDMKDLAPDDDIVSLDETKVQVIGALSDIEFMKEQAEKYTGSVYKDGGEMAKGGNVGGLYQDEVTGVVAKRGDAIWGVQYWKNGESLRGGSEETRLLEHLREEGLDDFVLHDSVKYSQKSVETLIRKLRKAGFKREKNNYGEKEFISYEKSTPNGLIGVVFYLSHVYAKGGLTKAELKLNMYKPSGDYFMEKKDGKIILHLTSKDASNLPSSFFEEYDVEHNGKGYYGQSYIVSKKFAKGGALKPIPKGNKGLPKLPKEVRNKMGYMEKGGEIKVVFYENAQAEKKNKIYNSQTFTDLDEAIDEARGFVESDFAFSGVVYENGKVVARYDVTDFGRDFAKGGKMAHGGGIDEDMLVSEYLDRLEDYHGEDVSWHKKNKSDSNTLRDELIDLGDEDFVKKSRGDKMAHGGGIDGQTFRSAVLWAQDDIHENYNYENSDLNIQHDLMSDYTELYKAANKFGIHDEDDWREIYETAFEEMGIENPPQFAKGGELKQRSKRRGDVGNRDKKSKVDTIKGDRYFEQIIYLDGKAVKEDMLSIQGGIDAINDQIRKKIPYNDNPSSNKIEFDFFKPNEPRSMSNRTMTIYEKEFSFEKGGKMAHGGVTKQSFLDFKDYVREMENDEHEKYFISTIDMYIKEPKSSYSFSDFKDYVREMENDEHEKYIITTTNMFLNESKYAQGGKMAHGGDIPKGYHKMPDGTIMADSEHNGKSGKMAHGGGVGESDDCPEYFLEVQGDTQKAYELLKKARWFDETSTRVYNDLEDIKGFVSNDKEILSRAEFYLDSKGISTSVIYNLKEKFWVDLDEESTGDQNWVWNTMYFAIEDRINPDYGYDTMTLVEEANENALNSGLIYTIKELGKRPIYKEISAIALKNIRRFWEENIKEIYLSKIPKYIESEMPKEPTLQDAQRIADKGAAMFYGEFEKKFKEYLNLMEGGFAKGYAKGGLTDAEGRYYYKSSGRFLSSAYFDGGLDFLNY